MTGFLFTILMRVLKNDFLRYARSDDEEQGECRDSVCGLFSACTDLFAQSLKLKKAGGNLFMATCSGSCCKYIAANILPLQPSQWGKRQLRIEMCFGGLQIPKPQRVVLCYHWEWSAAAMYVHRHPLSCVPGRLQVRKVCVVVSWLVSFTWTCSHYNRGALFVAALLIFALTSGPILGFSWKAKVLLLSSCVIAIWCHTRNQWLRGWKHVRKTRRQQLGLVAAAVVLPVLGAVFLGIVPRVRINVIGLKHAYFS